ncbi:uncharacterized protein N7518_009156 [Penicillium psychrosexuale]|uniref:uncharacterized protein n=1 Tax=Penicillium psychrosexuale TaxID=1002107 RepID=UPI002544F632|nr:uncharacterized protein N7518_009156 [Penicillium psychrosexuale]KAJ5783479.1 hypothetical protein N7518_009156 [Penicillium psychrosexuale]
MEGIDWRDDRTGCKDMWSDCSREGRKDEAAVRHWFSSNQELQTSERETVKEGGRGSDWRLVNGIPPLSMR